MKALLFAFSTLALAGLVSTSAAQEEAPAFFRVELVVFTHTDGEFDAWPVDTPAAPPANAHDPEWQRFAREQSETEDDASDTSTGADLRSALDVVEAIERLENGPATLPELLVRPDPWLAVDRLSEPMQQALDRLQNSPRYRVEQWLGWYQPLEPGRTGTVRVHDDRPLAADWVVLTPHGGLQRDGRLVTEAEQLFPDFRFRLDGTVRLRQRQFMHAEVSLYWHAPQTTGPLGLLTTDPAADLSRHHLQQSRTIRPDRLEYFDSPWLGVLLRVTPWEVEADGAGDDVATDGDDGS